MVDYYARDKALRKERIEFYEWALCQIIGKDKLYSSLGICVEGFPYEHDGWALHNFLANLYCAKVPEECREGIQFLYRAVMDRGQL